ncbi:DUF3306 domain-containing protein [Bradyrhizobium sp. LVM 105]|uniref:DUF3306 domain-containing protein n=1 Tax=Bradyrhizobium sp. LVM 105 TaxID=2341115 RepID=UPI000F7FE844|nr:DUF3306 domain-containing protein [Bradyrhizobium sp. LVM 105]RTE93478.1 DUF3306 domain-containing protein [Bradyrhizobium sp. LVM 105]
MSEEEFLSRWSRRKRESRAEPAKPAETQPTPAAETGNAESELDLSSLPSIDDINAATDITAFLRKNIPQELSRAALRRAWATDPAIRDFVGLAENAWDFNDPTAMPGFGPLDCSSEELAALVDRVVGGVREALQSAPEVGAADSLPQLHQADAAATADVTEPSDATDPLAIPVATQPAAVDRLADLAEPIRTRTHGGALPR